MRRGPMTQNELLTTRVRRYLRAEGFRLETVGNWDRADSAFAAIVIYSERDRHLAEILLTDPRGYLDVTAEEGNRIFIKIDWTKVEGIREDAR